MQTREARLEYVTWADVHELVRWLERGYGMRVRFMMTVACPKGEQHPKQYWEVSWCDENLEPRALPVRILGQFPSPNHKSLASCFLRLLWELDNALAELAVWTEPTIGSPRRGYRP